MISINKANMETKVCSRCGQEKPLEEFIKNAKIKSGYGSKCKKCHNEICKAYLDKKRAEKQLAFPVKLEKQVVDECESLNLAKLPARVLISELRRRGYRGELELVTIQKVVI